VPLCNRAAYAQAPVRLLARPRQGECPHSAGTSAPGGARGSAPCGGTGPPSPFATAPEASGAPPLSLPAPVSPFALAPGSSMGGREAARSPHSAPAPVGQVAAVSALAGASSKYRGAGPPADAADAAWRRGAPGCAAWAALSALALAHGAALAAALGSGDPACAAFGALLAAAGAGGAGLGARSLLRCGRAEAGMVAVRAWAACASRVPPQSLSCRSA
jgi:hypothetical protein